MKCTNWTFKIQTVKIWIIPFLEWIFWVRIWLWISFKIWRARARSISCKNLSSLLSFIGIWLVWLGKDCQDRQVFSWSKVLSLFGRQLCLFLIICLMKVIYLRRKNKKILTDNWSKLKNQFFNNLNKKLS